MAVFTPVTERRTRRMAATLRSRRCRRISRHLSPASRTAISFSRRRTASTCSRSSRISRPTQLPFYLDLMRHLAVASRAGARSDAAPRRLAVRHAARQARGHRDEARRRARTCADARALHRSRADARAHASRGTRLPAASAESAQPAVVAGKAPAIVDFLSREQRDLLRQRTRASGGVLRARPITQRCPKARATAICSATTCCSRTAREHARLGGFFDFYFAGCDKWLFDVAVTVNDWCIDLATGALDHARVEAMLRAYQTVRPFTPDEKRHWDDMLRAGAIRFWVSRLFDFHCPREAETAQRRTIPAISNAFCANASKPLLPSIDNHSHMQLIEVPAKTGYVWFRQGIWLFRRNPFAFLTLFFAYLFVMTLISRVPLLGPLLPLALHSGHRGRLHGGVPQHDRGQTRLADHSRRRLPLVRQRGRAAAARAGRAVYRRDGGDLRGIGARRRRHAAAAS